MSQAGGVTPGLTQLSLPPFERTPRHETQVAVVANRPIVGYEFEIVFHSPVIARAARPGQFVEILFGEGYSPFVRRPFSIYRVDRTEGYLSVLYLARGAFTSELARRRSGDFVSLLGPLGRPFQWAETPGTRHVLVAGGLGAPPLYFLASELSQSIVGARKRTVSPSWAATAPVLTDGSNDHEVVGGDSQAVETTGDSPGRSGRRRMATGIAAIDTAALAELASSTLVVINAARTDSLLVGVTEFGELDIALHVMTDDGSLGTMGVATDLLGFLLAAQSPAHAQTSIYACGPMPMLRAVGEIAIERGMPCQLSIETSMPCGIGLCQGCAIPVRDSCAEGFSYALACVDGPVFEARDLVWI